MRKDWVKHYGLRLLFPVAMIVVWLATPAESWFKQPATWQRLGEPGSLSAAHAHLDRNCAACHTPVAGVEAFKCISCHANNESLLQRQPTSFHASVSSCTECHLEHQGFGEQPTNMDHMALARIGLRQLETGATDTEMASARAYLNAWNRNGRASHSGISVLEATLDCKTCHSNDDRHFDLFSKDCAQCHATDRWAIPGFRHPPPSSMDCAQCHQAPPSHYMMHFSMISQRVAGKPHAKVNECFKCHQTTSWPDILGTGWYKHH